MRSAEVNPGKTFGLEGHIPNDNQQRTKPKDAVGRNGDVIWRQQLFLVTLRGFPTDHDLCFRLNMGVFRVAGWSRIKAATGIDPKIPESSGNVSDDATSSRTGRPSSGIRAGTSSNVVRAGEGRASRPQRSHWVVVNLKGSLDDGTVFEEHTDLKMILGDLETVSGLDISIALMEKKELAEIVVPPRFGYGELGRQPDVPPNATLHYQVELLDTMEPKEETDLPFHERQSIGDAKRERGNFWYGRGEFSNAAHCYRRALDFLDDMGLNLSESPPELQLLLDTRLKVYNNLAAAQIKMEAYEAALKSVDFVLRIQPGNVKALYRKGKVLACRGNVSEAVAVLERALKLEPESKVIQQELGRLSAKKQREDRAEKAMYRRMFGAQGTPQPQTPRPAQGRSWTWLAGGLVAVAALGVAAYRQVAAV
ncbi:peptidyl-prolyl cis-trans isomerase FKBP8 [Ixodes scapularis]